jgi:hypothetical protein
MMDKFMGNLMANLFISGLVLGIFAYTLQVPAFADDTAAFPKATASQGRSERQIFPGCASKGGSVASIGDKNEPDWTRRMAYPLPYGPAGSSLDGQWIVPLLLQYNRPERANELPQFVQYLYSLGFGGGEIPTRVVAKRWQFFQQQRCFFAASTSTVDTQKSFKIPKGTAYYKNGPSETSDPVLVTDENDYYVSRFMFLETTTGIYDNNLRNFVTVYFPKVAERISSESIFATPAAVDASKPGNATSIDPYMPPVTFSGVVEKLCGGLQDPSRWTLSINNTPQVTREAQLWTTWRRQDAIFKETFADAKKPAQNKFDTERQALKILISDYNYDWLQRPAPRVVGAPGASSDCY